MIDLWKTWPGDVIQRRNVAVMEQDVPLLVLACRHDVTKGNFGVNLSLLGLYMVANGSPYLREVNIDAIDAHEYDVIIAAWRPVQTKARRV